MSTISLPKKYIDFNLLKQHNILDTLISYLDNKSLLQFSLSGKYIYEEYKKLFYFRYIWKLEYFNKVHFNKKDEYDLNHVQISNSYLIKNSFDFIKEDNIEPLLSYLEDKETIAIMGGYVTSMYFNTPIYETSDIDIYFFERESGSDIEPPDKNLKLIEESTLKKKSIKKMEVGFSEYSSEEDDAPVLKKKSIKKIGGDFSESNSISKKSEYSSGEDEEPVLKKKIDDLEDYTSKQIPIFKAIPKPNVKKIYEEEEEEEEYYNPESFSNFKDYEDKKITEKSEYKDSLYEQYKKSKKDIPLSYPKKELEQKEVKKEPFQKEVELKEVQKEVKEVKKEPFQKEVKKEPFQKELEQKEVKEVKKEPFQKEVEQKEVKKEPFQKEVEQKEVKKEVEQKEVKKEVEQKEVKKVKEVEQKEVKEPSQKEIKEVELKEQKKEPAQKEVEQKEVKEVEQKKVPFIYNKPKKEEIRDFVNFLHSTYYIKTVTQEGGSCYTLTFENFSRKIQIISSSHYNIASALINYDNSHNRCAYYMGNTYVTPDAEISKNTGTTYFYTRITYKRYNKAIRYNLKILNKINKNIFNSDPITRENGFSDVNPILVVDNPSVLNKISNDIYDSFFTRYDDENNNLKNYYDENNLNLLKNYEYYKLHNFKDISKEIKKLSVILLLDVQNDNYFYRNRHRIFEDYSGTYQISGMYNAPIQNMPCGILLVKNQEEINKLVYIKKILFNILMLSKNENNKKELKFLQKTDKCCICFSDTCENIKDHRLIINAKTLPGYPYHNVPPPNPISVLDYDKVSGIYDTSIGHYIKLFDEENKIDKELYDNRNIKINIKIKFIKSCDRNVTLGEITNVPIEIIE